jgi:uncharacterized protein (TIGR02147 family)
LIRIGLLKNEDGKWKKTHTKINFPTTSSQQSVRKFHQQMILKSINAFRSSKIEDFGMRDITGITMPVNSTRIPDARKQIQKFRRRLYDFLSQGECDTLYQLNVQLFSLLTTKSGPNKKTGKYELL